MAALQTFRATKQAFAYTTGASVIDVSQDNTGAKVNKLWRLYHFNNGTALITGTLTSFQVRRTTLTTTPTGGSTITVVLHDTNNTLDSHTTAGTGRTISDSDLFRQYLYSTDEPAVSSSTMDEWELFVPFAEVWNAGYGDTNVQPLTARTGFGFHLKQTGAQITGSGDVEAEFTQE